MPSDKVANEERRSKGKESLSEARIDVRGPVLLLKVGGGPLGEASVHLVVLPLEGGPTEAPAGPGGVAPEAPTRRRLPVAFAEAFAKGQNFAAKGYLI